MVVVAVNMGNNGREKKGWCRIYPKERSLVEYKERQRGQQAYSIQAFPYSYMSSDGAVEEPRMVIYTKHSML